MRRVHAAVLLVGVLFGASGCSKGQGTVTGKVTFEGKPIVVGSVIMVGDDNQPVVGIIQEDGSYTAKGLPYGTVKVSVRSPQPFDRDLLKDAFGDRGKDKKLSERPKIDLSKWIEIPDDYGDPERSDLTVSVKQKAVVYDIPLKAKNK